MLLTSNFTADTDDDIETRLIVKMDLMLFGGPEVCRREKRRCWCFEKL